MAMKRVNTSIHPYEKEIGGYFSRGDIATDLRNHCVPIYDALQVPDRPHEMILVMPYLKQFNDPPFLTVGEVVDFLTQIFEVCSHVHTIYISQHILCCFSGIAIYARSLGSS